MRKLAAIFGAAAALALVIACAVSPDVAVAQTITDSERAAVAGPWNGIWTGKGFRYQAHMTLNVMANGEIDGMIEWTLLVSPRPSEAGKIGMKGIEYVRGRFNPAAAVLNFEGYRKDDPNVILGLDRYRLVVSEQYKSMGGITASGGGWDSQFYLSR